MSDPWLAVTPTKKEKRSSKRKSKKLNDTEKSEEKPKRSSKKSKREKDEKRRSSKKDKSKSSKKKKDEEDDHIPAEIEEEQDKKSPPDENVPSTTDVKDDAPPQEDNEVVIKDPKESTKTEEQEKTEKQLRDEKRRSLKSSQKKRTLKRKKLATQTRATIDQLMFEKEETDKPEIVPITPTTTFASDTVKIEEESATKLPEDFLFAADDDDEDEDCGDDDDDDDDDDDGEKEVEESTKVSDKSKEASIIPNEDTSKDPAITPNEDANKEAAVTPNEDGSKGAAVIPDATLDVAVMLHEDTKKDAVIPSANESRSVVPAIDRIMSSSPVGSPKGRRKTRRQQTAVEEPEIRKETPRELKAMFTEAQRKNERTAAKRKRTFPKTNSRTSMEPTSTPTGNTREKNIIELLFNKCKSKGILLEPFASAKIIYEANGSFEDIKNTFDDYEANKNIIKIDCGGSEEEEEPEEEEGVSEREIEEEDLPEADFKKPADVSVEYDDEWNEATAGGCFNYSSWRRNPQYLLFVEKTTQVEISLTQLAQGDEDFLLHIGFYIFHGNKYKKRVIAKEELFDKCSLEEKQNVCKLVKFAGSQTPYMIVPCTFDPDEISKFTIKASVMSGGPTLKLQRLVKGNDWIKNIIKGRWRKMNAGGCRNYPSHLNNDQFLISSPSGRCSGRIILQYRRQENSDELGIYILSPPAHLTHKVIHLLDAPLLNKSGFSLPNEAIMNFRMDTMDDKLLVIPCTFEPDRFATYRLVILSDVPIDIHPLPPPKYKEHTGEWKGATAVGCLNHPSWRNNPQYSLKTNGTVQVQLQKSDKKDETVVGFYVLKSSGGRQLEVHKENFFTKSSFMNSQSVTAQLDITEETTLTIVPCTFRPGHETEFCLRAFCDQHTSLLELEPATDHWVENMVRGKWSKGTAGGCINYASWRNNPQIRMIPEEDGEIVLALEQERNADQLPFSIGFYVLAKPVGNERVWSMESEEILHKAAFRKNLLNLSRMQVKKGFEYNIIPCAFSPWDECTYTFYAYGTQKVFLKRIHRSSQDRALRVKGKWTENTAGGCMANTSWPKNPHLLLSVPERDVEMEIMLQLESDKSDSPPAIGFCISKSDENGFPAISSVDDILYKVNYEEGSDITLHITIPASDTPYVITPSSYHPGVLGRFALQIFANESADLSLTDVHQNFEVDDEEDDFDVFSSAEVGEVVAASSRQGNEKMEEIVEEQENIAEQAIHSIKAFKVTSFATPRLETKAADAEEVSEEKSMVPDAPPPPNAPPPPMGPIIGNVPIKKIVRPSGLKTITTAPKPVSLFEQIKKGTALKIHVVDENENKKEPTFSFTPFNIDKIVARRAALEFSDDEASADEWDDEWDDEDSE